MAVPWDLVADIGGTNARFGVIQGEENKIIKEFNHSVLEYPKFSQVISTLLTQVGTSLGLNHSPHRICFAVACPADNEHISFTNSHWKFSKTELLCILGCQELTIINDFAAIAHGISELKLSDHIKIGGGSHLASLPMAILGPGTGLGVSAIVPSKKGYHVIDSEGGHADFAPVGDLQRSLLNYLVTKYERVSLERLLSGNGLMNIYSALCLSHSEHPSFVSPAEVVEASNHGSCAISKLTVSLFCEILGSTAGNLALTYGARGGVYISGGIVPRFKQSFVESGFRRAFENKGRFASYLAPIPVYLITKTNLGLVGAAKKLRADRELTYA
tara:strand:- start:91 stop:1080 length:990 start_codon:yes stop_codon:yes gene_type:complete